MAKKQAYTQLVPNIKSYQSKQKEVVVTVPSYAIMLDKGIGAHTKFQKNKMMSWKTFSGARQTAWKGFVNHPGTRRYNFISSALANSNKMAETAGVNITKNIKSLYK
jgi:hypothetical protein